MLKGVYFLLVICITVLSSCQTYTSFVRRVLLRAIPAYQLRFSRLSMSSIGSNNLNYCQLDSYARSSKNKLLSSTVHEDGTCSIVLEDSVLYPEGGGQPCDLGFVNGIPVLEVTKSSASGTEVLVKLVKALDVSEGDEVACEIDWNRRYDFMQQHTAQVIQRTL